MLVSIWAGNDGGHQAFVYENLDNGKNFVSIMTSDIDGDGQLDNLDRTIYDSAGRDIKSILDHNNDGSPELVVDRLNKRSFIGINGETRELIKKNDKRFVEKNGVLYEVKYEEEQWRFVQGKHITN